LAVFSGQLKIDIDFVRSFTYLIKKINSKLQILMAVRVGYFWHLLRKKGKER